MKKIATILTAFVMLLGTSAFASEGDNVSARVKEAFQTDFAGVSQVNWKKTSDFYFASFTLNNVQTDAAYDEEGRLIGTSRRIALAQLPLQVSLQLTKQFGTYTISDQVVELNYEGETRYYLTAEKNDQCLNLKVSGNGEITIESKTKK